MQISNFQHNPIKFGYGMWSTKDKHFEITTPQPPIDSNLKPEKEELYPDGEIKYQKYADGREVGYFDNGIPAFKINQDGTREEFYPTGLCKYRENSKGDAIGYHKNGIATAYKKFATGQVNYYPLSDRIAWQYYRPDPENVITPKRPINNKEFVVKYDNGNIKEEIKEDGTSISYYENGKFKRIRYADFTQETYYDDGTLKTLDNKKEHNTYYKDGQKHEIFSRFNGDSYGNEYYKNGQMKQDRHIDAQGDYPANKKYFENGNLQYIKDAYGYYKTFDKDGNLILEKSKIDSYKPAHIVDEIIDGIHVFTVNGVPTNKEDWTRANGGN